MKVFVWHQIDKCSDNYHEDGGVVVFASYEVCSSWATARRFDGATITVHQRQTLSA